MGFFDFLFKRTYRLVETTTMSKAKGLVTEFTVECDGIVIHMGSKDNCNQYLDYFKNNLTISTKRKTLRKEKL